MTTLLKDWYYIELPPPVPMIEIGWNHSQSSHFVIRHFEFVKRN